MFVNAKIYHIKTISIALYRAKIGYSLGCSLQSKNTTVYRQQHSKIRSRVSVDLYRIKIGHKRLCLALYGANTGHRKTPRAALNCVKIGHIQTVCV